MELHRGIGESIIFINHSEKEAATHYTRQHNFTNAIKVSLWAALYIVLMKS